MYSTEILIAELLQLIWFKADRSLANSQCVEVAHVSGRRIAMRDSKDPGGPMLVFEPDQWENFLAGARDNQFH
ncbi:DUF397 domain-containing protein [Nocardia jejuensis]|uniref:DUF397 domain-containing protein n=1 Tax=Nocardia jejuensis TaxID=328049 RepID=UPI000829BF7C|nr:DUF397 domain-containing protein [Nocardia jejuensis]